MAISAKYSRKNDCFRTRARPLTLKEVLQLRDGMRISRAHDSGYPYQAQKLSNDDRILLALN